MEKNKNYRLILTFLSLFFLGKIAKSSSTFSLFKQAPQMVVFPIEVPDDKTVYSSDTWGIKIETLVADGVTLQARRVAATYLVPENTTIRVESEEYLYVGGMDALTHVSDITQKSVAYEGYPPLPKVKQLQISYRARYPNGTFGKLRTINIVFPETRID
jgi:hypothetical protein